MLDRKALQAAGGSTGYRLERVEWPEGENHTLPLYLKPVSNVKCCEQSGTSCQKIHETAARQVRDLSLLEYLIVLDVPEPASNFARHMMLRRRLYASAKPVDLPAILDELLEQFGSGPMTAEAINAATLDSRRR